MIGYHCKLVIGEGIGDIQFFSLFEFLWLKAIGWLPNTADCLQGGLL